MESSRMAWTADGSLVGMERGPSYSASFGHPRSSRMLNLKSFACVVLAMFSTTVFVKLGVFDPSSQDPETATTANEHRVAAPRAAAATPVSSPAHSPTCQANPPREKPTPVAVPNPLGEFIAELGLVRDPSLQNRAEGDAMYRELFDVPNYEWVSDRIIASTFCVQDGETYVAAGSRLTELGKALCRIPKAESAFLCVVEADTLRGLGRIDLPLKSFLRFHLGDSTDQMMVEKMWETNSPMMIQRALEP